jgi:excisionase family DNA binding protein
MVADVLDPQFILGGDKSVFENLIDKKQLAQFLSLSLSYIDKLMAQEAIPYFKIGRAVRYRFSEVVAFLERRRRP